MKRLLLFTLLALLVLSAVKLPAAISAYAFGDYYFVLDHHKENVKDQNGFWLRRVYLTYESDISDKLKARARLEFNSTGNFSTTAANITPYLKDAYISYQYAPLHKLTVGIQDSLAFANIEKFYGYRHLEKTMFDLYKVRSSRDFAIDFSGAFDTAKKFNYSVQYGNYSGNKNETDKYKQVGARFFVNVTPKLMVEVNGDISTVSGVKTSTLIQGFIGYKDDWGRLGVNYGQEMVKEDNKDDVNFGVFSAFAVAKLGKKFEAVARYDMSMDPQLHGQGDYLLIEKGYKTNLAILGLAWNIHPKFQIMPNIKMVSYKENNGVKPASDTYFNLTWYYQF
ncbi:MAG TPA: porin [Candidatus Binatia bacterium]|nr:porin [Candidatus Binatia bacterium]